VRSPNMPSFIGEHGSLAEAVTTELVSHTGSCQATTVTATETRSHFNFARDSTSYQAISMYKDGWQDGSQGERTRRTCSHPL
jgi:hypothetical protein